MVCVSLCKYIYVHLHANSLQWILQVHCEVTLRIVPLVLGITVSDTLIIQCDQYYMWHVTLRTSDVSMLHNIVIRKVLAVYATFQNSFWCLGWCISILCLCACFTLYSFSLAILIRVENRMMAPYLFSVVNTHHLAPGCSRRLTMLIMYTASFTNQTKGACMHDSDMHAW